jgi:uncharacterized protein involved in outer membrane biogenesis
MNATLDFGDVDLSLFRSFPQLDIRLKNLTVTGINEFQNFQLLNVEALSASVNLSGLWSNNGLNVKKLSLDRPVFSFLVDSAGRANWDIAKSSGAPEAAEKEESKEIELEKITIRNAALKYEDKSSPMFFSVKDGEFDIPGTMRGSNSKLNIVGKADSLAFNYGGTSYAKNLKIEMKGALQSDFEKMSFQFLENKILVNKLPVEAEGTFILGENDYDFDITFKSPTSSFGELLGLVPEQYQPYLKNVETSGNLAFGGFVKGKYSESDIPAFTIDLKVDNGRLKYPDLPKEVEKIDIQARISKPQGEMDSTKIDIDKFDARIAGNPVSAALHIATPVSDPALSGNIKWNIDFASLKEAIPMDSIDIKGLIDAFVSFNGRYSSIEKEEYEKFQTNGTVSVKNFEFKSKELPQKVEIASANLTLDPKAIMLSNLTGNMGQSDFSANGALTNYWAYFLKKGTLNGNMNLNSKFLNINQMMISSAKGKDSISVNKPFIVPANINMSLLTTIDKILYDKMNITGVSGKMAIKEKKIILDGFNMNMLSGKMIMSGIYSTPNQSAPDFDFTMDIKNFDLPNAYKSLSTVRHFLPIAGESTGSFNSGLDISGKLGNDYVPIFNTLNGNGLLSSKNVEVIGTTLFSEISKYFRKDMFRQVKVNDFITNFKIVNGGVDISPFNTKIAGQEVAVSGRQSVTSELNYRLDFKVNKGDLSEEVNKYIGIVPGSENIEKLPIGVNIGGNFNNPEIKVDLTDAKRLVEKEFKKKAKSEIQNAVKKLGLDKLFK